jgi:RNA polymerase sigma-70 factor (ECF subfamily)
MDTAVSLPADLPAPDELAALLAREEGAIRRVIGFYIRRDPAASDDLYQEVCLRALRRIAQVRQPEALRGWIFQIARHACMDYLRSQDRRHVRPAPDLGEPEDRGAARAPADALLTAERIAAVRRALDELPPSQREAIRLRIEEDLDHDAIAARLGINRQAVEVRLCKGRAALKDRLAEIFEGDL